MYTGCEATGNARQRETPEEKKRVDSDAMAADESQPFGDVAEAFDPADADDGAAAPEKNEDAHATWLVVLLESVRQHDYGRRQDLGDGYIRDGSTPLKTFAKQLDLPLGDALRWYYGTLKSDPSGYADYKKACRVAWNEACDRASTSSPGPAIPS